jgi:hypothetical protein
VRSIGDREKKLFSTSFTSFSTDIFTNITDSFSLIRFGWFNGSNLSSKFSNSLSINARDDDNLSIFRMSCYNEIIWSFEDNLVRESN